MTRMRIPNRTAWHHISPVWVGRIYVNNRCECGGRIKRRHTIGVCVYTQRGGYGWYVDSLLKRYA